MNYRIPVFIYLFSVFTFIAGFGAGKPGALRYHTPKMQEEFIHKGTETFLPSAGATGIFREKNLNSIPGNPDRELDSYRTKTDTAIFAGGCFWGVEYFLQKAPGVISTEAGYIGGNMEFPTYRDVCSHTTGYAEAVRVVFDPGKTDYAALAKYFFNIHDPTQLDRQGPDIGDQYRSEIFYLNEDQKASAERLIGELKAKGLQVATRLAPATKFWVAEEYHQDYYLKENGTPYCHKFVNRF